ncbi:uncharacterized protein LOC126847538 [Adelges cooleyi]|uniref:uncharacterized protein LOC126847538 n=1 Tax=Adelges cooleyi TaxID=133065 RepID=UPI00218048FB|nr:uncharacterized protein LOC126847538 [Adelges cooleyi]
MTSTLSLVKQSLPDIVEAGAFGTGLRFESFVEDGDKAGQDQYASIVVFGDLSLSGGQRLQLVVKFKHRSPLLRLVFKSDQQFHNEIVMYERIIPFLEQCNGPAAAPMFPRYFYGRNVCGELALEDMVVLENVCPSGYRLSEERVFLDYQHVKIALIALAKFHGLSYTAKQKDNERFLKTLADMQESQWSEDGQWVVRDNGMTKMGRRGVDLLIERDAEKYRDNEHVRRLSEFMKDPDKNLRRMMNVHDPLSVLCHGDFCRNNMMFKYDEAGKPVDALLFDLAMIRYGSPAFDLSFFLYLNTDRQLRNERWDSLIDAYCSALAESVPDGVNVPDRARVDAEIAKYAVYGLSHVTFFLPIMVDTEHVMDLSKYGTVSADDWLDLLMAMGGAKGKALVADVYEHVVNMGFTDFEL